MKENKNIKIIFHSYNPYKRNFPNTRVVTKDVLDLIKFLRSEGYDVRVYPEDNSKITYLARKGVREILSDPVYATIINASISLIMSIFGNYLYNKFRKSPKEINLDMILEFDENGRKVKYNHIGSEISDERFNIILKSLDERANSYYNALRNRPTDSNHPLPIFLEHTAKLVGWGKLIQGDDNRLILEEGIIDDPNIMDRVDKKELNGLSITLLVEDVLCSICNSDYTLCEHISGTEYNGKKCTAELRSGKLVDVSLVAEPINPHCKLYLKGNK